jgi:hypothetical protein
MFARSYVVLVLVIALPLAACSEEDSPTAPTSTTTTTSSSGVNLAVTLEAAPDPTVATSSSGVTYVKDAQLLAYQWTTTFAVVVRLDAEQTASNVTSLSLALQQSSGGILITPVSGEDEQYRFATRPSGSRLEPGGEVVIEFDLFYTLPNQGKEAVITVSMDFLNDSGMTLNKNIQLQIAP